MTRSLLAVLLLLASNAAAQVRVEIRPAKPAFFEGEPIFFSVDLTNTGTYYLAYGMVGRDVKFEIPNQRPYAWRVVQCGESIVSGIGMGGIDHPPLLAPAKTVSLSYLLKGYRLKPGRHDIHVTGEAPVAWKQNYGAAYPGAGPEVQIPFKWSDPVEGRTIDRTLSIDVLPATAAQLRSVFEPILTKTDSFGEEGSEAREAVLEAARVEHLDLITKIASNPNFGRVRAYEALADINTAQSRAALRELFDDANEVDDRRAIVTALVRLREPDSLDFFASLLPGRMAGRVEWMKWDAVRGLECIGGEKAHQAILAGTRDWPNDYRRSELLQRLRSPTGVDAIIGVDYGTDLAEFYGACQSLISLTHYRWCDDDAIADVFDNPPDEAKVRPMIARSQKIWRSWWPAHRDSVRVYRREDPVPESLPKIW